MTDSIDEGPRLSLLYGRTDGGEPTPTDGAIAFHTLGGGPAVPPPRPALPAAPVTAQVRGLGPDPRVPARNPVTAAEEILRSAVQTAPVAPRADTATAPAAAKPAAETAAARRAAASKHARSWRSVSRWFLAVLVLGDVLIVAGSTWAAIAVVSLVKGHDMLVHTTIIAATLAVLGWTVAVAAMGGYSIRRPGFRGGALREALVGSAVVLSILASLRAVWGVGLPAAAILLAPLMTLVLGICARVVTRRVIRRARKQGRWLTRAVIVSTNTRPEVLVDRLDQRTGHGMSILGVCTDHDPVVSSAVPVLGGVEDTCEVALSLAVDMVVIDCDDMSPDNLRFLLWKLEKAGLAAVIAPPMGEIDPSRISIMPTMDSTLMGVRLGGHLGGWMLKSVFDRLVGTLMVCLLSPILITSAVAVAVSSKGPVFFRQTRVGQHGENFRMWKFRSMYIDAEERKAALQASSEGAGLLFKMKDDPRVTPVGKILRRYSIDELPQLFNVVLGDMALVGPRPALPQEVAEYDWDVAQRLKVRPGMTGLWQVSGRSDLSWEESVRLDLRYADNWSIRMDLAILWSTVGAVLSGRGAY